MTHKTTQLILDGVHTNVTYIITVNIMTEWFSEDISPSQMEIYVRINPL